MIGTSLGPYKILESLGAGGMGEVYLGEDTRLGRKVAIKVLPAQFAAMPDRLARFEQEARAAAALNHPHIAMVHDVGDAPLSDAGAGAEAAGNGADASAAGGATLVHFMVQEYLQGRPLGELLGEGRLPLQKALGLATEICEGLGAAHAAGILHRDLKPANVFVTREGHAKILDFGLAKLTELSVVGGSADTELSASPTVLGTLAGQVMGTAGYMAPEQVAGKPIDQRADIFAFGCVLYEMVAGRRAFAGETVLDTLHAIARSEPPALMEIDARLPAELQRILKKCLAKEPNLRYQGAQDLLVDLRALTIDVEAGRAVPVGVAFGTSAGIDVGAGRSRGLWVAVAVPAVILLMAVASAVTWRMARGEPPAVSVKRFVYDLPEEQRLTDDVRPFALSPDGKQLAYVTFDNRRLYLHALDQREARAIAGTESAEQPFFSPDGSWIGFMQNGELRKVAAAGGQPLTLTKLAGPAYLGADWGEDDTIVFSAGGGPLERVQAAGGVAEDITVVDTATGEQGHASPSFLPGAKAVLFTIFRGTTAPPEVALLDLASGERKTLISPGAEAVYLPGGHILYALDGSLWAVPFDLESRELTGQPAPVVNGVSMFAGATAAASVADDGTLFYLEGRSSDIDEGLVWLDTSGQITRFPDPPRRGEVWTPRLSPDGTRVAFRLDDTSGERNIWVMDIERGISSLLTPNGGARSFAWTPDGTWIYYSSDEKDAQAGGTLGTPAEGGTERTGTDIYRRRADMRAPPEEVMVAPGNQLVRSISPDGQWLLFASTDTLSTGEYDIKLLSVSEGGDPRDMFASPEREQTGNFSPDGKWVAFVAETTGQSEIYVQSFPNLGGLIQVSRSGGVEPAWSRDGSRLYFRAASNQDLLVTEVTSRDPISFSAPRVVVEGIFVGTVQNAGSFDVSDDPDRLVFVRGAAADDGFDPRSHLQVVVNWFDELRRLMAASGSR